MGQLIARALARPLRRITLGSVHNEAGVQGHMQTYLASVPGLLTQALHKAGRMDPILLL